MPPRSSRSPTVLYPRMAAHSPSTAICGRTCCDRVSTCGASRVGRDQSDLVQTEFVDDGCVLLAADTRNPKRQARAFVEWCEAESVDIVMGINSEGILSSLPHLPEAIRVVARCANGFERRLPRDLVVQRPPGGDRSARPQAARRSHAVLWR